MPNIQANLSVRQSLDLARVSVVGTSGAGKTSFARRLSRIRGTPHVELDALHWGPNWTQRPDFAELVRAAAERPTWIMDGNYSEVRDLIWRRATTLVWLDYAFGTVFSRALFRTGRRIVTRERLFAGNRESLRTALFDWEGIPWWVLRTYRRRRREYPLLLALPEYAQLTVIRLNAPQQAEAFLRAQQATVAAG